MKMMIGLLIMLGMFLLVGTKLVSGASWSAYIFEENGTGIDNVNVTAVLASNNDYVNSTLTNTNGFFNLTITNLIPVKLISSKPSYLTDTSQILPPISDDSVLLFNITLEEALPGNITGKITNSSGFDIENANISAIQGSTTIKSALSDSNGDYLLVDLLDGTYTIEASALGYTTQNTTNVVLLPNSTTSLNFSLTLETVPPIISNISATLITSFEAVIIWQTDEIANSIVYYGKANDSVLISGSSTLTISHMVRLSSLSSNILYYYNVSSCDFVGNCNTSKQFNFTTSEAIVESGGGSSGGGGGGGVAALTPTTKLLSEGARVTINVEGEIHYLEIIELTNTSIVINISSTPQQATLQIGEEEKFEITDDNYYDILVKLNGIDNNLANLTISYIHEEISKQLFDIIFNLLESSIQDISELTAIISFENFGTEPVRVNFLLTILDEGGKEVYSEDDSIFVESEEILRKSFEDVDIDLPRGKYTLILTTLYNVNIVNEFRKDFEIGREGIGITGRAVEFFEGSGKWYLVTIFWAIFLIGLVVYLIRKFKRDIKKLIREIEFKRNLMK